MKLTVVASNRNRLKLNEPSSQWFLKSIQWQNYSDFELIIVDGGSDNIAELRSYFEITKDRIPMRIINYAIGQAFERSLLNNVGIRNAQGEYIMTTDVDMLFHPKFMSSLMDRAAPKTMVESRTMYLTQTIAEKIYNGSVNPYNTEDYKYGRIKKRTTAGGCQCMHRDSWALVRGFDESYIGWGSEDYDLYNRAMMSGLICRWMGERDDIMLFHQPHHKTQEQIKLDLEFQEENKKRLAKVVNGLAVNIVNPKGWGGINDSQERMV